ncbi:NEL domain-containing protein [Endozoicomonas euniceicola]|uniref:RING-type E3 ubiquitin transferase n=1 Tax=Endozoicomonas euniceicola TaxID=1234143 RepID=A0ABY6H137_9GAMM|nr:NEL domain-containing protein [Endozoicomonas euniceicola]UYM18772.1 NEL domain-containing protein [Endozoicomonas euniceicola]
MHTGSSNSLLPQARSLQQAFPETTTASGYEQPPTNSCSISMPDQEGKRLPAAEGAGAFSPCRDHKVTPSAPAAIYVNPNHSSAGEQAFQAFLQRHGDMISSDVEDDIPLSPDINGTQILSAEEFKDILLSGKAFASDVCYVVQSDIDLSGNTWFKTLPDNLIVLGELNLEDCYTLRSFSKNLFVQKDCRITGCFNLEALGERLIVLEDFEACECTGLTSQTASLFVRGNIDMAGCSGLKTWTGKTQCNGSINLTGCSRLECLEQIDVEGDINLSSCYQLRGLPESVEAFKAGGDIVLSGCKRISPLPEHIITPGDGSDESERYITLNDWSNVQHRYSKDQNRNKNIIFDCQPLDDAPDETFADFAEAFGFWSRSAQSGQEAPGINHLEDFDRGTLVEFMEHLTRTADYRKSSHSGLLARRVLNILPLISGASDAETRQRALDIMYYAVNSCGDRVTLALHDLEALTQLIQSEKRAQECNDPDELKSIARQMMYIGKIREYACKLANENDLDDVEVELTLHLAFQNEFNLPGRTQDIESAYCFELDEKRRKEIREAIENECTEKALEAYLQNWPTWQQFERRQNIPAFDQLPVTYVTKVRECCDLTSEETSETTEMVLLPEPEDIQVTYKALYKSYLLDGKNPYTQKALDWSKVKKIQSGSGAV